jgi:CubicO group peptidase (beta-lactamase class C family)
MGEKAKELVKPQSNKRPGLARLKYILHFFNWRHYFLLIIAIVILILPAMGISGPSIEDLLAVDYTPRPENDWAVSTPEAQGLDPLLVAEMYYHAAELETIYSLLVIKGGYLIAEDYFNEGSIDQKDRLQSVTKSYTSSLVGIALDQGYLSSVDQKMLDFFPESVDQVADPRKAQITIRHMLQMRAGYPDEETNSAYLDALYWGEYLPLIADFPLVSDPGTEFHYSNLTSNWLAMIVARACDMDLKSYAQKHLFSPMGLEVGDWLQDRDGHYIGSGGIHLTAREAARFGALYLDDGAYQGNQIIPADWVRDSLRTYSENARNYGMSVRFHDMGYGYQWWSARAGERHFNFAWGHGGQLIVLLDELDMVIVTTADPFFGQHDGQSWKHEKAIMNLVGDFIKSLPKE